jgi:myo-inositol 2-dehydrogenase/D-chiro-inositol 1-dehydrogenase
LLGIAVLGCGRIGRMHARNIAVRSRAQLAGVHHTCRPVAEEVAGRLSVPALLSADAVKSAAVGKIVKTSEIG